MQARTLANFQRTQLFQNLVILKHGPSGAECFSRRSRGHLPPLLVRGVSRAACCKARSFPATWSVLACTGRRRAQGSAGAVIAPLFSKSLGPTRASIGACYCAGAFALSPRITEMKQEELKRALRLLTKVLADPRIGPDQGQRLQKAKRELEVVARSGKLDRERIFRAVEIVTAVLLELVV